VEISEFSERERLNALVLIVHNERPLDAAEVASLLRDLAADYRKVTKSTLVLGRLETGSTGFLLYDYLIYAGAAGTAITGVAVATGHMSKFVTWMKGFFKGTDKLAPVLAPSDSDLSKVAKFGNRLADTVMKNGGDLEFSFESNAKTGEHKIAFRVTHVEAMQARSREKVRQNLLRSPWALRRLSGPTIEQAQIEDFTRRLSEQAPTDAAFDQIGRLVETFVQFITDIGGRLHLPQIAQTFEMQGRSDIAQIIRRHIDPSSRDG